MYFYAQINNENICIGVSQLNTEIINTKMILIDENIFNQNILGWKYENGQFIEPVPVEPTEPIFEKLPIDDSKFKGNVISAQNEELLRALINSVETGQFTNIKDFKISQGRNNEKIEWYSLYNNLFINKDIGEFHIRIAVVLDELTVEEYELMTGLVYIPIIDIATIEAKPTNEELKEMQMISLMAQAEMDEKQEEYNLIQLEVLAEIYESMGVK